MLAPRAQRKEQTGLQVPLPGGLWRVRTCVESPRKEDEPNCGDEGDIESEVHLP